MTKDGIVSGIIGLALCFAGPFMDAGAIAEHAQRSPVGFVLILLGAMLVGYFASCLVHGADRELKAKVDALLDEKAERDVYVRKLEAEIAKTADLTMDEVRRRLEEGEEIEYAGFSVRKRPNGNVSLNWKG